MRERQLNEAQRIARVGDWRWDIATGRLTWSQEIFRIFGMDSSRDPTYTEFLAAVHPQDRVDVEARVRDALAGREPYAMDHRIVLPDGGERIVHEQAEVRHGPDGRPIEMIGIVQDVTERKRMEQALLNAKRDAETANEAKSRFLSTMGHELRTPLNAVNGFSQLIAEETFGPVGSPQYAEYAHLIHQSGQHLLDVINTILDATRVESGRMELARGLVLGPRIPAAHARPRAGRKRLSGSRDPAGEDGRSRAARRPPLAPAGVAEFGRQRR
ncbi:MAG: PAS domain-containing protein [Rhodovibrio sp.]|nr:PAS domain-containing protein [Rhodovibrio sp.]